MYNNRRSAKRSIFHIAGWLFADLLLALTIIFIAAATTGKPVSQAKIPTPTPTRVPHLELTSNRVEIDVTSNETVKAAVTTKFRSQKPSFLQGRRVGFVIIFTGAPTLDDIPTAQDTDETVKGVLQSLSIGDFAHATYYDSTNNNRVTDLTLLGYAASHIVIDIYLFGQ